MLSSIKPRQPNTRLTSHLPSQPTHQLTHSEYLRHILSISRGIPPLTHDANQRLEKRDEPLEVHEMPRRETRAEARDVHGELAQRGLQGAQREPEGGN